MFGVNHCIFKTRLGSPVYFTVQSEHSISDAEEKYSK